MTDKELFIKQLQWIKELRKVYWSIYFNKKAKEKLDEIINDMGENDGTR